MDNEKLDLYLKKAEQLASQFNESEQARNDLWNLIDQAIHANAEDPLYENFFKGEHAFYSKKYDIALKLYLQAQSLPNGNFFCYRASAYLFDQMDNGEKAQDFLEKALKIFPSDPFTLNLMEKLKDRTLDEDKIEELAHIFEERISPKELFAEERPPSAIRLTNMEIPMNTDSDIFSSPKSQETGNTQHLTERLYSRRKDAQETDPYLGKPLESNHFAFEELKKLASNSTGTEKEPFNNFMAAELGIDLGTGEALEKRIKAFQLAQAELTNQYLQQSKFRVQNPDHCFYYLSGWPQATEPTSRQAEPFFLTEQFRRMTGGLFLRWNGKGIAINPGDQFLKNFHRYGLHIHDIDYVIVTDDRIESYMDVKEIYDLNYQLNKVNPQLHIIHYYFSHKAFQDLSRLLKPHFKQERHILHSLEIFVDSPDVERIELSEGIYLNYFLALQRDYMNGRDVKEERKNQSLLGIRLDLKSPDKASVRIGYVGNSPWNPLLAHHLGTCDLLVTGFGGTSTNDYNKISYNPESLGYYGTFTLLEEVAPSVLLSGEYNGREGDIRLEVSQKMRNEYISHAGTSSRKLPVVLPADTGLFVCLKTLKIHCSVSNAWVEPSQIRVIKTTDAFGNLKYLAPSCCYQL